MNKTLVVITLVCALLMGTEASFGQSLINGTFDTDLNGWLIAPDIPDADRVVWYDQAAVLLNPGDFPLDHTPPPTFTDIFTFLQIPYPAGGNIDYSSLYQVLILPDNVDEVSFDVTMEVYNRESAGETDVLTATVWYGPDCSESERIYRLSSTDALYYGLEDDYIINETDYDGANWTHHVIYNIAASYDLSGWAGQEIILEFMLNHDYDDGVRTTVTLDDVVISEAGDVTPPAVTVGEMMELWPPNHKYRTFNLSDCVSVSDDTDELDIDEAGTILSIYSDEPEDVKGRGDGSTMDDIVVLGTSSFKVRAERQGTNNGRIYGVTFMVEDAAGNSTEATFYLGVPHDRSGHSPIVDDGAESGYVVTVF